MPPKKRAPQTAEVSHESLFSLSLFSLTDDMYRWQAASCVAYVGGCGVVCGGTVWVGVFKSETSGVDTPHDANSFFDTGRVGVRH